MRCLKDMQLKVSSCPGNPKRMTWGSHTVGQLVSVSSSGSWSYTRALAMNSIFTANLSESLDNGRNHPHFIGHNCGCLCLFMPCDSQKVFL